MELFEKYTPMLKEANFDAYKECNCEECDKKYECADAKLSETCDKMKEAVKKFNEKCPDGSKARNGACAKSDNSGYLKNVCDTGYVFDPTKSSPNKCVRHT